MPVFHYQALNAERSVLTGEVTADSVAAAVADLQAAGLTIQSISLVSAAAEQATATMSTAPASKTAAATADADILRGHMARVLEQGKLIVSALAAYAQEMPRGRRRRQLQTVVEVLNRGDAAEAASTLSVLPEYWIPLLSAAALSHDPGRLLREFLDDSRRTDEINRQWWLTLAYPLFIVLMALAVFAALSFVVMPVFISIFHDFDLNLPVLTRVVVGLATSFTSGKMLFAAPFSLLFLLLLIACWKLVPAIFRSTIADHINWPFGHTSAIARFARFTADLLEGGLELPDALRIAGHATKRADVRAAATSLAAATAAGAALPPPSLPLTAAVLYALRADIAAPSRIHLLREISNCHAARARIRLSWTRGFIEPLSICVVGALVGLIVVSLFLPLILLIDGLCR
jgi:type IV pilus assembly protein PilC